MSATPKFAFDTVFEKDGRVLEDPFSNRPKSHFSARELEDVRAKAYAEGRGAEEALAERAAAQALSQMAEALMRVLETLDADCARMRRLALNVAMMAAKKIGGAALDALPQAEVERVIAGVIDALPDEPRIIVRAGEAIAPKLGARLDALAAAHGFTGRLILRPTGGFGPADVAIEWSDGGLERSRETCERLIEEAVERLLTAAEHDPAALDAADDEDRHV